MIERRNKDSAIGMQYEDLVSMVQNNLILIVHQNLEIAIVIDVLRIVEVLV